MVYTNNKDIEKPTKNSSSRSGFSLGWRESQINIQVTNPNHLSIRRWFILICLSLMGFVNNSAFVTYTVNIPATEQYYGISEQGALWFSNIFFVVYIVGCIPSVYTWKWRFDVCLFIPAILNAGGSWLRYFAKTNYIYAIIGQAIIGAAKIWIMPGQVIVPEKWFPNNERVLATSIMYMSNVLGSSYGFFSSAYLVDGDQDKMESYLFICAIVLTSPILLMIFSIRNPIDFEAPHKTKKLTIKQTLKKCYKDPKSLIMIFSLSSYLGIGWILQASIDAILPNYSTISIGYMGLSMCIAGIIGGLSASLTLSKQVQQGKIPKYDLFLKLFSTISYIILILFILLITFKASVPGFFEFIFLSAIGLGVNAFIPISAQSLLESIYPANEVVSFTIYNQFANVLGLIGMLLFEIVGLWFLLVLMAPMYIYIAFFYKTNLKRLRTESQSMISYDPSAQSEITDDI